MVFAVELRFGKTCGVPFRSTGPPTSIGAGDPVAETEHYTRLLTIARGGSRCRRQLTQRTERVDAQRNRVKVLETADRLFGERGTSVSLGEIATEAGVGAGTVYRHFPTKDALLATVLDQRLLELNDYGAAALGRDDPEIAFFDYLGSSPGRRSPTARSARPWPPAATGRSPRSSRGTA